MPDRYRANTWARLVCGLAGACLTLQPAAAKAPERRFAIPAEPLASALLDFAVQAGMSIDTAAAARCRPNANPVAGRLRPKEALRRLLAGTGCGFRIIDVNAVLIVAEPAAIRTAPDASILREPASSGPSTLRELVITATRRTALLDRAPYSISAIDGADIEASGAEDLGDVSSQVAGLTVTNLGPGRNKLFVRGLSDGALTGRTQSTVGIYLDNVRVTYNAPDPDLRLVDIDKVELLRGPQGALYGAGSIGGVLHIVTRQPQLDALSASVTASGEATRGGDPSHAVDGMLNLPLSPGRLGLRVVAYTETQGGYINDPTLGLKNVDRTRREGFRAALKLQISSDWAATANLTRQSIVSDDTHYADPAAGPYARNNLLREPHDNDFLQGAVSLTGDATWGEVTATASILRHEFDSRYDASTALPLFAPGAAVAPSPFDEANHVELAVGEVTFASPQTRRARWIAGLFVSRGDNNTLSTLTAPLGPAGADTTVYFEDRRDVINEFALYGDLSYDLTPRATMTVGGRWFSASTDTTSTVRQPLANAATSFAGKTVDSGFAPQVVLRYQANERTLIYLQASEGYRADGFNTAGTVGQLFAGPGGGQEPARRFDGDRLWSYEAGAKLSLLRGRARVRTAVFYTTWTNIQSDQLLANGLPFTANIGDGRDYGWEVEAAVQPDERWSFNANLTLAEPELVRVDPAFPAVAGHGLPGAPRLSFGVTGRYERPIGPSLSAVARADFSYVGGSRLAFEAGTAPSMGEYGVGRLSVGLNARRWRLTAFAETAFGRKADTFAYGNPFTLRTRRQVTPARPPTVGLALSAHFD